MKVSHLCGIGVAVTVGVVAALAVPSFARADGVSRSAPVVSERPFTWTGFYVGAHVGYGWTDTNRLRDLDYYNGPYSDFRPGNADGAFAGLQIGYNVQFQRIVAGIEADFGLSGITGSGQFPDYVGVRLPTDSVASVDIERYATVTGRLGFLARDGLLIYGKAGWGWVHANVSFTDRDPVGGCCTLDSGTDRERNLNGPVWGGGVEYALGRWGSVKVEYLHLNVGDTITHTATSTGYPAYPRFAHDIKDIDTVKIGFNILLNRDRDVAPMK